MASHYRLLCHIPQLNHMWFKKHKDAKSPEDANPGVTEETGSPSLYLSAVFSVLSGLVLTHDYNVATAISGTRSKLKPYVGTRRSWLTFFCFGEKGAFPRIPLSGVPSCLLPPAHTWVVYRHERWVPHWHRAWGGRVKGPLQKQVLFFWRKREMVTCVNECWVISSTICCNTKQLWR